jgi:hypothetical protein
MPDTWVREVVGLPRVFDPHVTCPGGEPIAETAAGSGCECRVEQNALVASRDPSSLTQFCLADYCACPTWRAEKERVWAKQRAPLVSG